LKTILALTLIGAVLYAHPQSIRYPLAAPYTSLSAYSTQQNDVFSFTGNQAALTQITQACGGIYAERRFMLADISVYSLAVAMPTKMGNLGVQFNYSGFKNFTENKIGLAYARSLGSKVDVGIQFNYYGYRIPSYGNASAIYAAAGAVFHVSSKLNAGVHIYNPAAVKIGKEGAERLAYAYKFGLGYDASEYFFVSGEIIKEEDKPVNVLAGVQYQFAKRFFARAGFLSESSTAFAGAGVSWKNLRVDLSGSYHPQLGLSPGVLLIANFGNEKK
jgi:hypothetical protein